jgi:hypothetical protein
MTTWRPLSPEVVLVAAGEPDPLPIALQDRVDRAWNEARDKNATLFDGGVFSHHRVDMDSQGRVIRIEGRMVPYSRYLACRVDGDLGDELGLWVMGVTGLLLCLEGAVAGRRSRTATGAGELELAPAGTIGRSDVREGTIDVRRCILAELEEEVGLAAADLSEMPEPFALVEDEATRVADVALWMRSLLPFDQIAAIHGQQPGREYDQLRLVRRSDSALRLLLPTSQALIDAAAGLLHGASLGSLGGTPGNRGIISGVAPAEPSASLEDKS